MKRAFSPPRKGLVSSKYHLRARTGQCTLSSGENSFKLKRNTSLGVNEPDWFLSNRRDGRRRTPPFSHRRWHASILQEWTQLPRLAEASWRRKAVLTATDLNGAVWIGSKGGPASYLSTVGRSHVSLRVLGLAETTNKPLIRVDKSVLDDTVVPSGNPLWMAAIADLYPVMVEGAKGLPLWSTIRRPFRNSATSATGASAGPTPRSTHHRR